MLLGVPCKPFITHVTIECHPGCQAGPLPLRCLPPPAATPLTCLPAGSRPCVRWLAGRPGRWGRTAAGGRTGSRQGSEEAGSKARARGLRLSIKANGRAMGAEISTGVGWDRDSQTLGLLRVGPSRAAEGARAQFAMQG